MDRGSSEDEANQCSSNNSPPCLATGRRSLALSLAAAVSLSACVAQLQTQIFPHLQIEYAIGPVEIMAAVVKFAPMVRGALPLAMGRGCEARDAHGVGAGCRRSGPAAGCAEIALGGV